jgi:cation transporter-like permease
MSWIVKFAAACAVLIVVGLLAVWGVEGFKSLGVDGHIAFAMFLGIFFTILVSVVLMGLIFYSHRSGHDEAAQDFSEPAPTADDKPDNDSTFRR